MPRLINLFAFPASNRTDLACLEELLFGKTTNKGLLDNVLDWMGDPALPLVKKYFEKGKTQRGATASSTVLPR